MKFRANKMLGLAVGERSILVAEVTAAGDVCQFARCSAFGYTEGATLQQPQALGEALGRFLKQEGYTAKAAVVGIPAKWVLTKSKDLPPIDPAMATEMLRMQIEAEFSVEIKDLVYDYAGQTSAGAASQVMLAAATQRHVEIVRTIATAARLDLLGITPTTVALSAVSLGGRGDGLVLSITPSGAELAGQRNASPSLLRHVGSTAAVTANVAGEVRRAALLLPRNGSSNGASGGNGPVNGHAQGQIVVWDDGIVDPAARRAAMTALGPAARSGEFSALGAGDPPAGVAGCAAAAALAVAGITDAPLAVDFLHPRLAAPKKAAIERRTVLAIAAGVMVVVGIIFAKVDVYSREKERDSKLYQVEQGKKSRKDVESEVAIIDYARNWHAGNPRYLDCMRDLTHDFPADGQIFVTSFTMHDNMKCEIGGKSTASNDKSVRELADRLRARPDKRFQEVDLKSVDKKQIQRGQEISFTITFRYVPAEPAPH